MRVFRSYLEQMNEIRQDEWLMDLNIATNPHRTSETQGKLWDRLQPPKPPSKEMSDERKREARAVADRMKARRDGV